MNQCILTGNLGNDPEMFFSSEGEAIATLSIAFRSGKKKTNWVKVTCFGKLAEICQKYLHKGAKIAVMGSLDQEKWETDKGEKRSSYRVIAQNIEFIKTDGRGFADGEDQDDVPF